MKTYDINEAADFLKIDRSTALDLAHLGTLPGAKVGRAWVFMEDELVAYLRDVTRNRTGIVSNFSKLVPLRAWYCAFQIPSHLRAFFG